MEKNKLELSLVLIAVHKHVRKLLFHYEVLILTDLKRSYN